MRLDHLGFNDNPHQRCSLIGQSGKDVTVYRRNRSVSLSNCMSPKGPMSSLISCPHSRGIFQYQPCRSWLLMYPVRMLDGFDGSRGPSATPMPSGEDTNLGLTESFEIPYIKAMMPFNKIHCPTCTCANHLLLTFELRMFS
jgi:hypothetical protein